YRTTSYFLERMGMGSIDELPDIAPLLPEIDDMDDELSFGGVTVEKTADVAEAVLDADDTDTEPDAEEPDTLNSDRG
ncbi:MAG: transcriptional regulator, partial [Aeromicrobium sp.]|nr:transcriptional regulator [Aeromicrobium sp.]